jgi:hypothetical protein
MTKRDQIRMELVEGMVRCGRQLLAKSRSRWRTSPANNEKARQRAGAGLGDLGCHGITVTVGR